MDERMDDYKIKVVERPRIKIFGKSVITNRNNSMYDCQKIWSDLAPFIGDVDKSLEHHTELFGVYWLLDKSGENFEYWAALPVTHKLAIPKNMSVGHLDEGLYAMIQIASMKEIPAILDYLFYKWVPLNPKYQLSYYKSCYEHCHGNCMRNGEFYLYFPVLDALSSAKHSSP